jgi:hypothetical protein
MYIETIALLDFAESGSSGIHRTADIELFLSLTALYPDTKDILPFHGNHCFKSWKKRGLNSIFASFLEFQLP